MHTGVRWCAMAACSHGRWQKTTDENCQALASDGVGSFYFLLERRPHRKEHDRPSYEIDVAIKKPGGHLTRAARRTPKSCREGKQLMEQR